MDQDRNAGPRVPEVRAAWLFAVAAFIVVDTAQGFLFRGFISGGGITAKKAMFFMVSEAPFKVLLWTALIWSRRRWPLLLCMVAQAVYQYVNLAYFEFYNTYLTVSTIFARIKDAFALVGGDAAPFKLLRYWFIFINLPLGGFIAFFHRPIRSALESAKTRIIRLALLPSSGLLVLSVFIGAFANPDLTRFASLSDSVSAYGLPVFQIGHFIKWESGKNNELAEIKTEGRRLIGQDRGFRKRIAIVQVESMGSDAYFAMKDGAPVMPYLHQLASRSVFFPFMMTYHRGGGTSDVEFTCISSCEPLRDYPAMNLTLDYQSSFVKMLKEAGYSTVAYHGNNGGFFNRSSAFPLMGFDEFFDRDKIGSKTSGWGIPDHDVFGFAMRDADRLGRASLQYIITMSSHGPYTNVLRYFSPPFGRNGQSSNEYNYYLSLRYVDGELRGLVEGLSRRGVDIIIIYGDHTDRYLSNAERTGPRSTLNLDENQLEFTPLFIIGGEASAGRGAETAAGLLDIAPTALTASGIPFALTTPGENLLSGKEPLNELPYAGHSYSRRELYRQLMEKMVPGE